jgi:hypothetical protein
MTTVAESFWLRLKSPTTLLLGTVAVLLLTTLVGGLVFGALGMGERYIELWLAAMISLFVGVATSAVFAFLQYRADQVALEEVYSSLTEQTFTRTESEEYPMDGRGPTKTLEETKGKLISITRKPETHVILADVDYGVERGKVKAELAFEPHQQIFAKGRFEYVDGPCSPGHGRYHLDVWDDGKRLMVRWSSVSNVRGHEGWELWTRSDIANVKASTKV